jgi:hypothetical protein
LVPGSGFDVATLGTTLTFLTIIEEGSDYGIDIVASRQPGGREVIRVL